MMRHLVRVAVLAVASTFVPVVDGVVIAKSTLNQCFQTDTGLTGCENKLVVAVTVENGENATSSLELSILSAAVDGEDQQLANRQISVVLRKTPVYFYYPTTYFETYNYQPWEQLAYGSLSGTDFTPFNDNIFFGAINSCIDGDFEDAPSCGWAYDADGNQISSSQGKCCKCTAFQLAGFDDIYMTRSNLQCGLSSAYTQSSHCLRYDPLWYHTYSIGTASTFFAIQVETHYCDKNGDNCTVTSISLSPNSRSAKSDDSLVFAQLVGDLATFEAAPTFESYYLAVPSGLSGDDCNGLEDPSRDFSLYSRCLDHIAAGSDYYMFVPKSSFGAECNKVGVDYANFRFQSDFCTQEFGSCTGNQLADFFEADQKAAEAGATGRYWASNQGSLGLSQLTLESSAGQSVGDLQQSVQPVAGADASLVFQTDRYQTSLLVLELAADDITYVVCLGTAEIRSTSLPTFEANGASGSLTVTVASTSTAAPGSGDDCNAAFLVEVTACSAGIIPAITASSIDLAAGQSETVSINIKYEATIGTEQGQHNCTLQIWDAYANVVDSKFLNFETTVTVTERPQDEDCSATNSCGNAAGQGLIDPCLCQWYEFSCIFDDWDDCSSSFWNFIIIIGVVGLVLVCCCIGCCALGPKGCIKCIFLPCRLIGRCCKKARDKREKKSKHRGSRRDSDDDNDGYYNDRDRPRDERRHQSVAMSELPSRCQGSSARGSKSTKKYAVEDGKASLVNNKMPSPVHTRGVGDGAQRLAQRLCGPVYFNVSGGMSTGFTALVQPGHHFSLRGHLQQVPATQAGSANNVFNFQVPAQHDTQFMYFDEASHSYLRVAPPRQIPDADRRQLGGSMLDTDVVRFVTNTPKFCVLNEAAPAGQ